MPDREKVIKALGCRAENDDFDDFPCFLCAYYKQDEKPVARCDYRGLMNDAIVLLKEQQQIWEFQDQVEYLTDKLKEQQKLIDEIIQRRANNGAFD